jgi:hypothetical protein
VPLPSPSFSSPDGFTTDTTCFFSTLVSPSRPTVNYREGNVSLIVAQRAGAEREITLAVDNDALIEEAKLDGCYVLKTDLLEAAATKEVIHDRYKDLALVESAFRTSKTVELELRPIHVRLASCTRAHAFVVMIAYRIVKELSLRWQNMNVTVQEGINELTTLCASEVLINGAVKINDIPEPRKSVKGLLDAAKVRLPKFLPCSGINVTTKKKLQENRNKY